MTTTTPCPLCPDHFHTTTPGWLAQAGETCGHADHNTRPSEEIRYVLPLGNNRRAMIWAPADLTTAEAERLAALPAALVIPQDQP